MPPKRTRSITQANLLAQIEELEEQNRRLQEELQSAAERSDTATSERAIPSTSSWAISGRDAKEAIPKFRPGRDNPLTSKQWISTIEHLIQIHHWQSAQALYYAKTRLRGAAEQWCIGRAFNIQSWERFKTDFLEAFPDIVDYASVRMDMIKRAKKDDEEIEDYCYWMQAKGELLKMTEKEIVQQIVAGLSDLEVKTCLLNTKSETIPNIIAEIRNTEAVIEQARLRRLMLAEPLKDKRSREKPFVMRRDRKKKRHSPYPPTENNGKQENKDGKDLPLAGNNNQGAGKKLLRCFICKEEGHFARKCPKRLKSAVKSDFQVGAVRRVAALNNSFVKPAILSSNPNVTIQSMLDLGSECSTITETCVKKFNLITQPSVGILKGFAGGRCVSEKAVIETVEIEGVRANLKLHVVPDNVQNTELLIGMDILNNSTIEVTCTQNGCQIREAVEKLISTIYPEKLSESEVQIDLNTSEEKRQELLNLLNKFRDCFSKDLQEIGCTKFVKMTINVTSSKLIQHKPRRVAYGHREEFEKLIRQLLKAGIIVPSTSSYASPVVLTIKPDGSIRICVDYRDLNEITRRDLFPMPNIEEKLNMLHGKTVFCVLDLFSGYYQVEIEEASRHLTAFITPSGHYEFVRMPFGLTNAPSVFLRLMARVAEGLEEKGVIVFMDDVLIASTSLDECIETLQVFMERLREANLTLNLDKCKFFQTSVTYLGHRIDKHGAHPGEVKVEAIKRFPKPKNTHEVRRFLGMAGFFRKFVKDFASVSRPLSQLLRANVSFVWETEQEEAFEAIKTVLTTEPVLVLYDPNAQHEVVTDASSIGLSGILMQLNSDGDRQAVSYFSRATSKDETKYSSYELETLAVLASLERFQYYLLGKKFTVITDCQSLQATKKKRELNARIARWWMKLMIFDFEIKHRPAKWVRAADAMSRAPVVEEEDCEMTDAQVLRVAIDSESWISTLQNQDEKINEIIEVLTGKRLNHPEKKHWEKEYTFADGRLYKNTVSGLRFVVPKGCLYYVLKGAHDDCGHPGPRSILRNVLVNCLELVPEENLHNVDEMKELRSKALTQMSEYYDRSADKYNQKARHPRKYDVGDIVLIRAVHPATGQSQKTLERFRGPYVIVRVRDGDRYEVSDTESTQITQIPYHAVVPADRLKLWPKLQDYDLGVIDEWKEDDIEMEE
ncbi:Zinc finger, CCHC-type [Sergentomyia squamirostris]